MLKYWNKIIWNNQQKKSESGRTRTCNLLIRSQTRYPLRHRPLIASKCEWLFKNKYNKMDQSLLKIIINQLNQVKIFTFIVLTKINYLLKKVKKYIISFKKLYKIDKYV